MILNAIVEKLKRQQGTEQKISQLMDYPKRWYQGIPGPGGKMIQDMAFECEATESEILAIKAVGGVPETMDASGYIKLCPEQQRLLVRWREEIGKSKATKGK